MVCSNYDGNRSGLTNFYRKGHMDVDRQTTRQGQSDSEVRGPPSEGLWGSGLIDLKTCFLLRKIDRGPVVFGEQMEESVPDFDYHEA